MSFTITSIPLKGRAVAKFSALILTTIAFSVSSYSGQMPKIFHHWPHVGSMTAIVDVDAGPNIYHHWPHAAPSIASRDTHTSSDIFHHWPHFALLELGNDNDSSPDIFHHWPHAA